MFDDFKPKRCFIIETTMPVGFAYFDIPGNKLDIWSIQIKRTYQRKGLGEKLTKYIINFAREKRLKKVVLEAHDRNKKAVSFYQKLGFRKIKSPRTHKIGFEYNL